MKVRCIANKRTDIPESYFLPHLGYKKEMEFNLVIDKEYVVYALYEWQGTVWYYICDERYTYYPIHNPAPLFQVVDNRLSKYWTVEIAANGLLTLAFEQWFAKPDFYGKLTDQNEEEVLMFEQVKYLMDVEAASIKTDDKFMHQAAAQIS